MQVKSVLLLHIPQAPRSESSFIQVAPLGLVGMANYIKEQLDVEVTIMNAGSLLAHQPDIVISDYVLEKRFDIIMLDLHWHQQLFDVLQVVDSLKTKENYIVIGGITASVFGHELLNKNKNIDFLIKGEGETPAVKLIEAINGQYNYTDIPNLVWRDSYGSIKENETTFHADSNFLNNLNDWDLSIYDTHAPYVGKIKKNQESYDFFYVPVGRGCMEECSYCAGSNSSFARCFNRRYVTYRNPETVANTIINVHKKYHFSCFYICYDIKEIPEQWWLKLFELISDAKIEIGLYFEAYRIPSYKFLTSFANTFQKSKSQIILSPGCFSDIARKKYTSVRYTLEDVESFLDLTGNEIPIYIYFSLIPDREEIDINNIISNIKWCKKIIDRYWNVAIYVSPIVLEPNAPWEKKPELYGISKEINNLDDFIENSNLYQKTNMTLGYKFDFNKLIAAIYYGITNRLPLTDLNTNDVEIINSPIEIGNLNNDLSEKTLIINSNEYEAYISALFQYKTNINTPEKLIFRKIIFPNDVIINIELAQIENSSFFAIPLDFAINLRNLFDYQRMFSEVSIVHNLTYYKLFFDNLMQHTRSQGVPINNTIIYIPNIIPKKIFPILIKGEKYFNYYMASTNGYLFKEISFDSFQSILSVL